MRSNDRRNPQRRNQETAVPRGLLGGGGLDAVVPVFRDEPSHPCRVIAVKDSVFGTPHNQAVDLDSLLLPDIPHTAGEVGAIFVNGQVRPDPNC